jgi:hypothetical protein
VLSPLLGIVGRPKGKAVKSLLLTLAWAPLLQSSPRAAGALAFSSVSRIVVAGGHRARPAPRTEQGVV